MNNIEEIIEVEERIETVDGVRMNMDTGEILSADFSIDSLDRAQWATRKILQFTTEQKALTLQYEEDMKKLTKEKNSFLEFFAPQLMEYTLQAQAEAGGKGKVSVRLGQVSFLKKSAYLKVVDATAGLEWAIEHMQGVVEHIVPEPYDKLNNKEYIASAEKSGIRFPGIDEIPAKIHATLELEAVGEKIKLSDYGLQREQEVINLDNE